MLYDEYVKLGVSVPSAESLRRHVESARAWRAKLLVAFAGAAAAVAESSETAGAADAAAATAAAAAASTKAKKMSMKVATELLQEGQKLMCQVPELRALRDAMKAYKEWHAALKATGIEDGDANVKVRVLQWCAPSPPPPLSLSLSLSVCPTAHRITSSSSPPSIIPRTHARANRTLSR